MNTTIRPQLRAAIYCRRHSRFASLTRAQTCVSRNENVPARWGHSDDLTIALVELWNGDKLSAMRRWDLSRRRSISSWATV
jgi:hypothetical protein